MSIAIVRTGTFWALFPVVLLGSLVATEFVLVHKALSDPSMAVEDRYYAKALSWDQQRADERRSASLGFRADVTLTSASRADADVVLTLLDKAGVPVRGAAVDVDAFAVVRSNHIVHGSLREGADGSYRARLPLDRLGRWEVSVRAVRGAERFTAVLRQDLVGSTNG